MRTLTRALPALILLSTAAWALDERSDFDKALDYGRNLNLLLSVGADAQDLAAMLVTSRALIRLQAEYDKAHEGALQGAQRFLQLEKEALLKGTQLPRETTAALSHLRETEDLRYQRLLQDAEAQMRLLTRRMSDTVMQGVDWSRPGDFPAPPSEDTRLADLRAVINRLERVGNMLDRIRYLIPADYITTRTQRLGEFLESYEYVPDSPEFRQAMDFMFRLTDESRRLPENEWPDQQYVFAARVLLYVGDLDYRLPEPGPREGYNWWSMYDLLRDPQTPAMLSKLLAALGALPPATN